MNYIKHLTGFFEKVSADFDLNPTHISLYMAIFQLWNQNRFQNPIGISRDELMRISKIASYATYHKCIKELDERNFVKYMPSYNPFKGSTLEVVNLDFYTKPIQLWAESVAAELQLDLLESVGAWPAIIIT